MAERSFYSFELGRRVIVRGLTASEMVRTKEAVDNLSALSEKASEMAAFIEVVRGGLVFPELETFDDAYRFCEANKHTARRAFELIQELTTQ